MINRNKRHLIALPIIISTLLFTSNVLANGSNEINRLTQKLNKQQQQIDSQAKAIKSLEEKKDSSFVQSRDNKVQLKISGQVNQALMYVADGREKNLFVVTTNDNSISRIAFEGILKASDKLTFGSNVELGLKVNRSDDVSQADPTPGDSLDFRKVEFTINAEDIGKLSLGKGNTASDGTAEVDFSGTKVVALSNVSKIGGGLFFRTPSGSVDDDKTNTTVGTAFNNIDGFSRRNRLRYDSPSMYGFTISTSVAEEERYDVAVRYKKQYSAAKVGAAAAYTSAVKNFPDAPSTTASGVDGSASILFNNGINLSVAGGRLESKTKDRNSAHYYYVKAGYLAELCEKGKTAFSGDYGRYHDFAANSDLGESYALSIVQNFDAWNFAAYFGAREFMLDRSGAHFKDIYTVTTGGIFKF